MMYRYTASLGLNADGFTEFYQNDVIHKGYRAIDPVPRDRVRCSDFADPGCVEASVGGEIFYRFTNIELQDKLKFYSSNFFAGVGTAIGTTLMDGYVELGGEPAPDPGDHRISGVARGGHDPGGRHPPGHGQGTALPRAGPGILPGPGIILSNHFSYHSGLFVDDQGREIRRQFWTIGIDIDSFYFEAFNDLLGGTDIGPTFGGRFYWDIEKPGRILSAVESFVQNLNKSR